MQTLVGAQETRFEDLAAFLNQYLADNPAAIAIRVGVCVSMLYHFVACYPTPVMRIKICEMLKHPEGSQEHASAMVLLCRHLLFDEKEGALGRFLNFVGPKARHAFKFLFYFENSSTLYVFFLFFFLFCFLLSNLCAGSSLWKSSARQLTNADGLAIGRVLAAARVGSTARNGVRGIPKPTNKDYAVFLFVWNAFMICKTRSYSFVSCV